MTRFNTYYERFERDLIPFQAEGELVTVPTAIPIERESSHTRCSTPDT